MLYYNPDAVTKISKVSSPTDQGLVIVDANGDLVDAGVLMSDVATLTAGKLDPNVLPDLAISNATVVADEPAMLALTAEVGDLAIRSDTSETYVLAGADPTVLANWIKLLFPADVLSVNGETGVVTINADNLPVALTPTAYTAATPDVEAHLTGIDTELLNLDARLDVVEPNVKIIITSALDLYLDGDNGDDINDGSSLASAFATCERLHAELTKYSIQGGTLSIYIAPNTLSRYSGLDINDGILAGHGGALKLNSTTGSVEDIIFEDSVDRLLNISKLQGVDIYIDNLNFKRDLQYANETCFNLNEANHFFGNNVGFDGTVVLGNTLRLFCKGVTVGSNATEARLLAINCGYEFGGKIEDISLDNGAYINFNNVYKTRVGGTTTILSPSIAARTDRRIYVFTNCNKTDIKGTLNFGAETSYGLARITNSSNINIDQAYLADAATASTFGGGDPFLIEGCQFITISPNSVNNKLTITNKLRLLDNVSVITDDETFANLPFDGAVLKGSNVIVNNIDGTEVAVAATPANYTAATPDVEAHLVGIDTALSQFSANSETALTTATEETANFTAVVDNLHPVDCSAGVITVTPPATPADGQKFALVDSRASSATNNITVDFATAGQNLYGSLDTFVFNEDGSYVEFKYINSVIGWIAQK